MADTKHRGWTLDDFLEGEDTLGEFQTQAIKVVIAWKLAEAIKYRKLTKTYLVYIIADFQLVQCLRFLIYKLLSGFLPLPISGSFDA